MRVFAAPRATQRHARSEPERAFFARDDAAHVDRGNACLRASRLKVVPPPGQLVLFPAWLADVCRTQARSVDPVPLL